MVQEMQLLEEQLRREREWADYTACESESRYVQLQADLYSLMQINKAMMENLHERDARLSQQAAPPPVSVSNPTRYGVLSIPHNRPHANSTALLAHDLPLPHIVAPTNTMPAGGAPPIFILPSPIQHASTSSYEESLLRLAPQGVGNALGLRAMPNQHTSSSVVSSASSAQPIKKITESLITNCKTSPSSRKATR
jgi:hypothetical protein